MRLATGEQHLISAFARDDFQTVRSSGGKLGKMRRHFHGIQLDPLN